MVFHSLSFRGVACVCVCAEGSLVLENCKCNLTDKLFRVAREVCVCVCLGGNKVVTCFFQQKWVYIISCTVGYFLSRADLQTCKAITQNLLT